jgi:hypothetical protein
MAKASASPGKEILEAALQGLEAQRQKLDEQISQVRSMMGQSAPDPRSGQAQKAGSPPRQANQVGGNES